MFLRINSKIVTQYLFYSNFSKSGFYKQWGLAKASAVNAFLLFQGRTPGGAAHHILFSVLFGQSFCNDTNEPEGGSKSSLN